MVSAGEQLVAPEVHLDLQRQVPLLRVKVDSAVAEVY